LSLWTLLYSSLFFLPAHALIMYLLPFPFNGLLCCLPKILWGEGTCELCGDKPEHLVPVEPELKSV
jgi:hypothetical protein